MGNEILNPRFEVSFEICNKVGGIYTVVKSKAGLMKEQYKEDYICIGPYFAEKVIGEFEEKIPPNGMKKAFDELKKQGIICHYGTWLIDGRPNTILIDFENYRNRTNDIKSEFWEHFQVDSLNAAHDYDEPLCWGYAAGVVIEYLTTHTKCESCVAHFHEWLAGSGLLYLKMKKAKVATVFTTHATILGRTLASSGYDLYNNLKTINPDEEAKRCNINAKFSLEKQSALHSDVFTTVSEITGIEAEFLLGRKPDILLPNGLYIEKFPTFEELMIKHRHQREKIKEFVSYFFFPYYQFNIDRTLFFFIAGRYEFKDKGIDIYIKALGKLNQALKKQKSDRTIIAFVWVPGNIRGTKQQILENRIFYKDIKDTLDEELEDIKRRITSSIIANTKINEKSLFEDDTLMELKSKVKRLSRKGPPPVGTHDLFDKNNEILHAIDEAGLKNAKDDPVKIIYYPTYLSGADGLLDLTYYESMQGSHLGVFPSYYEPWGYTPLEAGALGVTSVTTDLAGFGRYIEKEIELNDKTPGVFVLKRFNQPDDVILANLVKIMKDFQGLSKHDRVANKMEARKIAAKADWKTFISNYFEAHDLALKRLS